jgi:hypothetical protein
MAFNFSSRVKVLAKEDGAKESQIEDLKRRYPLLPSEYADLVRDATEIEVEFENGRSLRVWGPAGCLEMDEAYLISSLITGSIPIGDDGGGHVIYYYCGNKGWGIYCNGFGDLDAESAVWITGSLAQLLGDHHGADRLPR